MFIPPLVAAIISCVLVEIFFMVIKYRDSLNSNGPRPNFTDYIPLYQPIGYMSVRQFLSGGERRWVLYFLFRYTPHVVVLLLLSAILQKYWLLDNVLGYLLLATTISVLYRNVWGWYNAKFVSERILHAFNSVMLYLITFGVWTLSELTSLAFFAPSVSGVLDNLWSSVLAATAVLLYARATNPNAKFDDKQAEETARDNHVLRAYNLIRTNHEATISLGCQKYACSKPILYAVVIYENMNRPPSLRKLENIIVRFVKVPLTVGIAQVKSDKPLSDAESIEKAARILSGSASADNEFAGGFVDMQQLEGLLEKYNQSALYAESIAEIMSVLRRYTDVFSFENNGPYGYSTSYENGI
jgi:hypothetical protein